MNVYEKKSVLNRYFIILQRNDRWLWNFTASLFWKSLKCLSLHSPSLLPVCKAQRAWEVRRKDRQLASTDQCLGRLKIRISFTKK